MQPASYGSLSPDEMRVGAAERVSRYGLAALTRSQAGTGGRAPMPKARRKLFIQAYWKGTLPHPDMTQGDPFGTQDRREETTGGKVY